MSLRVHNRRVAMDGRMLDVSGTGVATYARALRGALRTIADPRLILTDRFGAESAAPFARERRLLAALSSAERAARPLPERSATGESLLFARDIFRIAHVHFRLRGRLLTVRLPGPPGIMHWTYPVPLHIDGWANLYTVHDVIPLIHPDLTPINARRHARLLRCITGAAARLVTVSEAARAEIVAALGCPAAQVANCGQAVDVGGWERRAAPSGLPPCGYLLACGTVEVRKNLARLVEAYRASGVALPLVIAGPDGSGSEALAAALATPGVIRMPYLDRDDMLALIAQARALLMPSLAEGFGLPVAEALALGTPVVTSRGGALGETAGGAALLVDPRDTAAITDAIRRIAANDALCAALAAAGPPAAERFTLARFAGRLATLYDAVIAEPR